MLSIPVSMLPTPPQAGAFPLTQPGPLRPRGRTVLIVTSDASLRERLRQSLSGLRWNVIEAPGGAEAWDAAEKASLEALLVDPWLPDLDVTEFLADFRRQHPQVDMLMTDGISVTDSPRSAYHQELRYALRRSQDTDTVAWNVAPPMELPGERREEPVRSAAPAAVEVRVGAPQVGNPESLVAPSAVSARAVIERIPELVGNSQLMLEVSRRIRLVAGRSTPVLIEGPTGSGKELVAEALHRLSSRARKPFVAINCAAIPEALLEAELFGHTRGAFTGAVQGRTGRIESADGGTLFLDEIGEMPLALQSKLLRFVESGELQRIGDNETVKVDVRIVAATHQPLAEDSRKGEFRADLYYRLAVFLIRTPPLVEHMEDLPLLIQHFTDRMGRKAPVKRVDPSAVARLGGHSWPGNVRELQHVLERASILAGESPWITADEIDFGLGLVN